MEMSSNAAERAYQTIRARIMDGSVPPGAALREEALAAEIGVSRTPVRDALRRLLADGLVESARNRGTFVAEITTDDLLEVYQLRAMLEGFAGGGRQAASRPGSWPRCAGWRTRWRRSRARPSRWWRVSTR